MNLGELIVLCREDLDDLNAPYLVSDESLTRYLNSAVDEACHRAFLLYDEDTAAVCQLALVVGEQVYALDSSILRIESVHNSAGTPLYRMPGLPQLDAAGIPWRGIDGAPTGFAVRRAKLYVNYVPTATDTLTLGVYRMPLAAERMADESDEPAIPAQFHEKLIHWAAYRAFSRPDSELYSTERAASHNALFEAAFGRSSSARGRALNQEMSSRPSIAAPPYGGTRSYNRTFNW